MLHHATHCARFPHGSPTRRSGFGLWSPTTPPSQASACGVWMDRPAGAHRPGFATILVLMLIFMTMIMAITYLRTMRAYQQVSVPMPSASAKPVAQQLITDLGVLIGADGNLNVTAYEPYDYPWTCNRRNAPYRLAYPTATNGIGAMGDPKVDDSWLAPLETEASVWTQVSNPAGTFLVYTDASLSNVQPNFQTRDRVPMDAPAGASIPSVAVDGSGQPQQVSFQNLSVSDPRLVDTDGDGLGDALWFYPNKSWSNGVRYVAAVRVVDLSGMLNIQTALGEFASAPGTNSGTPRKGEGPYEVNAVPLLGAMPAASKTFRQTGILTVPSGRAAGSWSNWDYWCASGARTQDNGSSAGSGTNRYNLDQELQLRDYSNQFTASPFPVIRQHYASLENNLVLRNRTTTISGAYEAYGAMPTSPLRDPNGSGFGYMRRPFDIYANQNNLNQPAPLAGYPSISGSGSDPFTYGGWWDIAHFWESGTYGVTDSMWGIDNGNANASYPYPEGFKFLTQYTSADDRARQYQIQLGANTFQDALGRDDLHTVASQWSGWEPTPMLTEFYGQVPYAIARTPVPIGSTAGNFSVEYTNNCASRATVGTVDATRAAGIGSYAFEMVNPYAVPIRLGNVCFCFRNQGYNSFSGNSYNATNFSPPLSDFIAAAPPVGMAKDAEGYYVLKPGEKVVFYRNGNENAAATKPFGGNPDVSALITGGSGVYTVNMGTLLADTRSDLDISGGSYSGDVVRLFELVSRTQWSSGGAVGNAQYGYRPFSRVTFVNPFGTSSAANSYIVETNVPADRKGAQWNLVYRQFDVQTFGADEKLNILQAVPPLYTFNTQVPTNWGDWQYKDNFHANTVSGATALPFPVISSIGGLSDKCFQNDGSRQPVSANCNQYDTSISKLGQSVKRPFPAGRQNIKNEKWACNYVGIPGDTDYPGTFPELTALSNANRTVRDNPTAGGGAERRDGLLPLDLLKVPAVAPLYLIHYPGVWWNGNWNYRGTPTTTEAQSPTLSANSPLVGNWYANTMGDALNFYLTKDTGNLGLRGLCLRTDVPWFDWTNAATRYPVLPYSSGAMYTNGKEALSNGEIFAAQNQPTGGATLPAPNATPGTGNVGDGKVWGYSNGAYAKAGLFWQQSWGELLCSRWQVDSAKYKGYIGVNGQTFKPGMINLNTASREVLKCLSLPNRPGTSTPVDKDTVVDAILAARKEPTAGLSVPGGFRRGLVLASEAFGAAGLKSYSPDSTLVSGSGTTKFYTGNQDLNLETLAWLPQQASCRSDIFCAYIVVQGYNEKDFTSGPVDSCRAVVIYSRNPYSNGAAATVLSSSFIVRRQAADGDPNDWYTP